MASFPRSDADGFGVGRRARLATRTMQAKPRKDVRLMKYSALSSVVAGLTLGAILLPGTALAEKRTPFTATQQPAWLASVTDSEEYVFDRESPLFTDFMDSTELRVAGSGSYVMCAVDLIADMSAVPIILLSHRAYAGKIHASSPSCAERRNHTLHRHARPCAGHPRLSCIEARRGWQRKSGLPDFRTKLCRKSGKPDLR